MRTRRNRRGPEEGREKGLEAFHRLSHGPVGLSETCRMPSPFQLTTKEDPEMPTAISVGL